MSYLTRLNTLLTSTTSRYDSLRRNILSSSSTEDDTSLTDPSASHVSRVLRAYYTEKQRPFPEWLGPDPRTQQREQGQQQMAYNTSRPVGSLRSNASEGGSMRGASGGGGLGDIWGSDAGGGGVEGSLRRGPASRIRPGMASSASSSSMASEGQNAGLNVRPLPSQRVGSYQHQGRDVGRSQSPVPPGSSGGAAERLKARLNRGGSARSVNQVDGGGGGGGRFGEREGEGGGGEGSHATQGVSGWQGRR